MGRELQKKKNRSSLNRVRRKPKSKKKILNNPIIAQNWNQKETLTQNYRRLGLTSKLNHVAGGLEKTGKDAAAANSSSSIQEQQPPSSSNLLVPSSSLPKTITPTEVRVERDPETGAILRIIDADTTTTTARANPLNDPLNDLDDDSEAEEWNGFANVPAQDDTATPTTDVVRQLEAQAASGVRKAPRKQSAREQEWIEKLVAKHGDDYKAMFRDRRLNPMQQSEGDLKQRVKKWRASQGGASA